MKIKLFISKVAVIASLLVYGESSASESADNVNDRIRESRAFREGLAWVGEQAPPQTESQHLWEALTVFQSERDASALESFLSAHTNSAWGPSLRSVLARHYRENGRYTLALQHWEAVWDATKTAPSGSAKQIADFTLAHWTLLLASLGRVEKLQQIFQESAGRTLDQGPLLQQVLNTREALGTMRARPGIAFRCGTFALQAIAAGAKMTNAVRELLTIESPPTGFSMTELKKISDRLELGLIPVRRPSGSELVVPSVVHWKQNHYAAIVGRRDGLYHVVDPTFGNSLQMSADTINHESSGVFFVPSSKVPAGWTHLQAPETDTIFGKGWPTGFDVDNPCEQCPCPAGAGGGGGSSGGRNGSPPGPAGCRGCGTRGSIDRAGAPAPGMPHWRISEPHISLWIDDEPLGYQPARGSRVAFRLAYHQRDAVDPSTDWSSVGKRWNSSWLAYVQEDGDGYAKMYAPSGGVRRYQTSSPTLPEYRSNAYMDRMTDGSGALTGFKVRYRDGAMDVYGFVVSGSPNTAFLTAQVTSAGHTNRFEYTQNGNVVRLVRLIDAQNQTNHIYYEATNHPYSTNLITKVVDPFQRETRLHYSSSGHLTNIIDVINMPSFFFYETNGWITNMTTPYGATAFQFLYAGDNLRPVETNNRTALIIEPNDRKHLYVFREQTSWLPSEYPDQPAEADLPANTQRTANHNYRNSYYWNPQQFAALPDSVKTNISLLTTNDFKLARLRHWLHLYIKESYPFPDKFFTQRPEIGQTLHIERQPSPTASPLVEGQKTWYYYDGIHDLGFEGTTMRPSVIAQVINNDAAQGTHYVSFVYNTPSVVGYQVLQETSTYTQSDGTRGTRTRQFSYETNEVDLLRVVDWGGHGTTNRYNANHQIVATTNALGYWETNLYDSNGQLKKVGRSTGLTTTYSYDANGYLTNITDVEIGRSESFTYTNGLVHIHTDALGNQTTNLWDNLQRLVSASDARGYISNIYTHLDLTATRDRLGNWRYFAYDKIRRNTGITNELGHATIYSYCDCGALGSITDPLTNTTAFYYDLNGRMTNVVYPGGLSVTNHYNLFGQLIRVADSTGNNITNWYNNQGLIVAVSNAFGRVQSTAYDIEDRPTSSTDANGVTIETTYDDLGRVLTRTYPDTGVEKFQYSARGLIGYTNQIDAVTKYTYDEAGRKIGETNANNEVTIFKYDASGNLTNLIDGKIQNTYWKYDQYGRVTNKLDHLGTNMLRYAYDANGRLTNRWTPAKTNTFYAYDKAGNLTNINYETSTDITLAYDANNRLTNMIDAVGTTRFTYSAFGAISTEDGPWENDTVTYGYDNGQRRSSLSLLQPNASPWSQSYTYDTASRLSTLSSPAGTFTYKYFYGGSWVTNLALPMGAAITNGYDSIGRLRATVLKSSGGSILSSNIYIYDLAGRRMTNARTGNVWTRYSYDGADQLKTANAYDTNNTLRTPEQFGYLYDAAGNLQRRTNALFEQIFAVNNLNQLTNTTRTGTLTVAGIHSGPATSVTVNGLGGTLYADGVFARAGFGLSDGNNTFTAVGIDALNRTNTDAVTAYLPASPTIKYDANGNLTNDSHRVFDYDDENQLTRITVATSWKSEFAYDGKMRRRIRREFTWQNGTWVLTNEVRYIYDGKLVIQERGNFNIPSVSYTRGIDLSGTREDAGGIGGLLARADHSTLNPQHAYYYADANGNISALIDTNQTVVARYAYEPFGNVFSMTGSLSDVNLYRFSSKEAHLPSGLVHYPYRYYDPSFQKWITRDPIAELGFHVMARRTASARGSLDNNLYSFVLNRPIVATDPLGLSLWVCTSRAFGIIGINHAYMWDDREGTAREDRNCSMQGSSGSPGTRDANAIGPPPGSPPGFDVFYGPEDSGVTCTRVPNSNGKEDDAIKCCRDPNKSNNGIWFPGINDCHNPLDDCLEEAGIPPEDIPPHPRFGKNNGIQ